MDTFNHVYSSGAPVRPGNHRPRCAGFTLVELLVVVAVVSLLMGLMLPALSRSRASAKAAACLNNMRSFGQALVMYTSDNAWYFPRSSHTVGSVTNPIAWLQSLEPYGVIVQSRFCPEDPAKAQRLSSYATNDYLEPLTPGIDFSPISGHTLPGGRTKAYTRITELSNPIATIYAVEAAGTGTIDHIHAVGWTSPSQVSAAITVTRHFGTANYLYTDGHAGPIVWRDLQSTFTPATSPFNPVTAH